MNVRSLIAAAPLAAILAGAPAAVHADTVSIGGDCAAISITELGYPDGARIIVGLDAEPPYGFDVGTPDPFGRFTPITGGYTGSITASGYDVAHVYVNVIAGGVDAQVATATLDCSTPAVAEIADAQVAAIDPPVPCQEDEPCWDCATMGNLICGPLHTVERLLRFGPQ